MISGGLIFTLVYIQNAPNSHFINRWDGLCERALYEEPSTLIFFGRQCNLGMYIGTLLRDLTVTKLWEVVAVEELVDHSTMPPQYNTRCYVRHTRPPSAPGDLPTPSFSNP